MHLEFEQAHVGVTTPWIAARFARNHWDWATTRQPSFVAGNEIRDVASRNRFLLEFPVTRSILE